MGRSSITVSDDAKARFDEFKRNGETVEAAFLRLLDAAEDEFRGDVLTEAHIDDIAAEVAARTSTRLYEDLR